MPPWLIHPPFANNKAHPYSNSQLNPQLPPAISPESEKVAPLPSQLYLLDSRFLILVGQSLGAAAKVDFLLHLSTAPHPPRRLLSLGRRSFALGITMSYYNEPSWSAPAPGRQASWEQSQPPSRSGASSTVNRDEPTAFASQFDEVDRAAENLAKSGKPFGPGFPPTPLGNSRRESMPMMGGVAPRPFPDYDQRMGGPQRHHSNQRYAPRPNDADQMAQAKRRMAAQRERELRNYHQEQQYHRNVSGSKSDRSMSPNAMNEEERRELIARQHRALYGETSTLYNNNPTSSQDVRVQTSQAGRGPSPLAFDPFGMQPQSNSSGEAAVQMPPRGDKDVAGGAQEARANSNSSPSSNQNPAFALFDAQQSSRASNSSPGGSPPVPGPKANNGSGVAPIGTRPQNQSLHQPANASMSKRTTSPLPSPLGYNSYNASEQTTSAPMNPSSTATDKGVGIWNNGPWSNTPNQGVQASVWG
ncbi:hypothetical protein IAQ61_007262 [Plenodomus lingam]|uniref:uncharacterized protein n=1 Tax=Leptosphaeria maculans TaxID=5022 RepID=UPI0033203ADD|nr:hypothetical protein IAQ61_007262 [Plenodomus lingam]